MSSILIGGINTNHLPKKYEDQILALELKSDSLLMEVKCKSEEVNTVLMKLDTLKKDKYYSTPCIGCVLTSRYRSRARPNHIGIDLDIVDPSNQNIAYIRAIKSGIIVHDTLPGYGLIATVSHSKYQKSRYAHLRAFVTKDSVHVQKGQVIALMGNTGASKGKHLHLEILERTDTTKQFKPINPESKIYLKPVKIRNYGFRQNNNVNSRHRFSTMAAR